MEDPVLENGEPVVEAAEHVEAPEVEAAPEAPSWQGPSQEEWSTVTQSLAQLSQSLAPAPVETVQPGIDSYGDESGELTLEGLSRFVQDQISAGVQERLGQFEPVLNQTVADRGEQLINQEFEKLSASGDFDRTLARELAEGYASAGVAPDEAIKRGAERARDFANSQRQAGVEEYKTTLGNIGSAPREPGVNGAGVPVEGPPEGASAADQYKWIADNWAARKKL